MTLTGAPQEATTRPARRLPRWLSVQSVILAILLGVPGFFVIYPIFVVLRRAFIDTTARPALVQQSLTDPALATVVFNTVGIVTVSGILAIIFASLCAWLSERTDMGGSAMERFLPILPLMVPTIAAVIGWVTLLSPRVGLINVNLRAILNSFGLELTTGPFDIFTWPGYAFVMFLYLFPFVYILVLRAFQSIDPALEEAASVNRAGPFRTFMTVTLPAIKPALSASALIVIIQGIANFSIAIIIGTGAGIDVLSSRIYRLLYNYPPNIEQAVLMSLFMTAVVQVALVVQRTVLRKERFAVIGGKASRGTRVRLGWLRLPARFLVLAYLAATSIIPLVGLVIVSLQPFWSANLSLARMSLANYSKVLFERAITAQAIFNSISLGVVGGIIGIALVTWILILVQKRTGWISTFADFLLALPSALPHSIVGVSFILAFSQGWLNLHGTYALLLIAYLVMFLPQAAGAANAATRLVGNELTEAAYINNASAFTTLRRIQIPLMLPALMSGWVILFVHMSGELTASALLSGVRTPVVGIVLLDMWENGSFPEVAAMAVIITAVFSAVVLVSMMLTTGKRFRIREA